MMDKKEQEDRASIYLFSTDTGERRKLTFPPSTADSDRQPAFSPSGREIAFIRWHPVRRRKYIGDQYGEIHVQSVDGGEPRHLPVPHHGALDLDWLPDGSAVVAVCVKEHKTSLWRVPVDGRGPTKIPFGDGARAVSVAMTGDRLAFVETSPRTSSVWRVDGPAAAERSPPERLIASTRMDWRPVYSPDASLIAFVSQGTSARSVWICEGDGKNCRNKTHKGNANSPSWSPGGKSLALAWEIGGNTDVYVIDVPEAVRRRRLTREKAYDGFPEFSKDGRWIYFASNRTGVLEIWKVSREGGAPIQVTHGGGGGLAKVSEDGRSLYIARPIEGSNLVDIVTHSLQDGSETTILEKTTSAYNWDIWKGSLIYGDPVMEIFLSLRRLDLTRNEEDEIAALTVEGWVGNGLSVSRDGRWIVYSVLDLETTDLKLVENFH